MNRRRQDVSSVRISDEEYGRLESKLEALKNEVSSVGIFKSSVKKHPKKHQKSPKINVPNFERSDSPLAGIVTASSIYHQV